MYNSDQIVVGIDRKFYRIGNAYADCTPLEGNYSVCYTYTTCMHKEKGSEDIYAPSLKEFLKLTEEEKQSIMDISHAKLLEKVVSISHFTDSKTGKNPTVEEAIQSFENARVYLDIENPIGFWDEEGDESRIYRAIGRDDYFLSVEIDNGGYMRSITTFNDTYFGHNIKSMEDMVKLFENSKKSCKWKLY